MFQAILRTKRGDSHGTRALSDEDHLPGDGEIYGEVEFNRLLARERKRTERSGRPFALMLLDLTELQSGAGASELVTRVTDAVVSCTREVDIKGWYRDGQILALIFTEFNGSREAASGEVLRVRVRDCLELHLDQERFNRIKITLYMFPEGPAVGGDRSRSPDPILYPDIVKNEHRKRSSRVLKRVLDIAGSISLGLILSPVIIIIAALIKLTSDGPVLFRQERVGRLGRRFTFLKFRSMYLDNDPSIHKEYVRNLIRRSTSDKSNGGERVFKIEHDPRVTPVGRFIRKTSLDELPQLVNVLMGDMSIVGPRPPIPYELENYEMWHLRRVLEMKPGITGLWQVKGRSKTTFDEMVRLDLQYARQWSLWLDLKLMLMTPWVMVTCKGGY